MKVTLKRVTALTNGDLVQLNVSNIAEPFSSGSLLGVAENCRSIDLKETTDSPIETVDICEVVINGSCQAVLSGSAPATGGLIYANGQRVTTSASGSAIGRLIPRGWSTTNSFSDGETVTIFIFGEH